MATTRKTPKTITVRMPDGVTHTVDTTKIRTGVRGPRSDAEYAQLVEDMTNASVARARRRDRKGRFARRGLLARLTKRVTRP